MRAGVDHAEVERGKAANARATTAFFVFLVAAASIPLVSRLTYASGYWTVVACVAAAASCSVASGRARSATASRAWRLAAGACTHAAIGCFSGVAGPFMIGPTCSVALTATAVAFGTRNTAPLHIAFALLSFLLPQVLEWSGVVTPGFTFHGDVILLQSPFMGMPIGMLQARVGIAVMTVGAIALGSMVTFRMSQTDRSFRTRVLTQIWQLRAMSAVGE